MWLSQFTAYKELSSTDIISQLNYTVYSIYKYNVHYYCRLYLNKHLHVVIKYNSKPRSTYKFSRCTDDSCPTLLHVSFSQFLNINWVKTILQDYVARYSVCSAFTIKTILFIQSLCSILVERQTHKQILWMSSALSDHCVPAKQINSSIAFL